MKAFFGESIFTMLGLDGWSILFYAVNLIVLIGLLVLILYKPVKKMLKEKRQALDDTFKENERLKEESDKLNAEYNKMVEDMKVESARVAAEVASSARERADAIVEQAKEQANAILDAAKKDASGQKEQLKNEYRDSVNKLAVQIAQKLLEREISDADNSALIEQVLSDWED